jgi:hypothetical protein
LDSIVAEANLDITPSINDSLLKLKADRIELYLKEIQTRNNKFFADESDKLDKWSDDIKEGLEVEIKNIDKEIRKLQKEFKEIATLEEKVKAQRTIKNLEKKRNEKRRTLFEEQDRVELEKDKLIENIENRMKLKIDETEAFQIRWEII